jgi:putative nucleotidyltransferase with HDIG domain
MSAPEPSKSLVFLVDDEPGVLSALAKLLERAGYPVETFQNPMEALLALPDREVSVLLTDKDMPEMDGMELATRCLETDPDLAVIMLTGYGDVKSAAEAVRLGIEDYLLKPPDFKALEGAVQRAVWRRASRIFSREMERWYRAEVEARADEIARQKQELEKVSVGALAALTRALEAKNPHFRGHSEAVGDLAGRMARELGMADMEIKTVRIAGLLHDIGMIAVPDWIIEKEGSLTPEEYGLLKDHCRIGEEIVKPFAHLGEAGEYVLHHHERLDGSGYPHGLEGAEISPGAQIIGVAESFVALTEDRSFRDSMTPEEALETLRERQDVWFDGGMLDALALALESGGGG